MKSGRGELKKSEWKNGRKGREEEKKSNEKGEKRKKQSAFNLQMAQLPKMRSCHPLGSLSHVYFVNTMKIIRFVWVALKTKS